MRQILRRFLKDEGASAAVEYGLIGAIIVVAAMIAMSYVGINFKTIITVTNNLNT